MATIFRLIPIVLILLGWIDQIQSQSYQFVSFPQVTDQCHPNIEVIFFDSRNRMWLGTSGGGVCLFDGRTFMRPGESKKLTPGYFISSITEAPDGTIWVISEKGSFQFNGFQWKSTSKIEVTPNAKLIQFGESGVSIVDKGLIYQHGQKDSGEVWISDTRIPGPFVDVFSLDQNHTVQVWDDELEIVNSNTGSTVVSVPFTYPTDEVVEIAGSPTSFYLALNKGGVFKCDAHGCELLRQLPEYTINDMIIDLENRIWIATEFSGLILFNPFTRLLREIDVGKSSEVVPIDDLALDLHGSIWLSARRRGIMQFAGEKFQTLEVPGMYSSDIENIRVDIEDVLWVLNRQGKVWNQGRNFGPLRVESDALINEEITDLVFLNEDKHLLLSRDGTILLNDLNKRSVIPIYQVDSNQIWQKLAADRLQNIWVLSNRDLYQIELDFLNVFPFIELHDKKCEWDGDLRIQDIHVDKKNRIWWYTEREIGYYFNSDFVYLPVPAFLKNISSWYEDNQGKLWIGTLGSGLYVIDLYQPDPNIEIIHSQTPQNWPDIYQLLVEHDEVYFITQTDIYKAIIDRISNQILSWRNLGISENFDLGSLQKNAFVKNRYNEIFIGTPQGVVQMNSDATTNNLKTLPPITVINNVEIDFQNIYESELANDLLAWNTQKNAIELRPTQNDIHFNFSAPNYNERRDIQYRWRLLGSDAHWSPLIVHQDVYFSNLSPGSYSFEVKACLPEAECSNQIASFTFKILAPIYRKAWFISLAVSLLLSFIIFGMILRNKRMQSKNAEIQERLKLENRVLDLERKALQLQMNPHFIFNAMNTIQSEIKSDSFQVAKSHLAKFSRLMRKVLESSRQSFVPLDDEIEMLEDYIAIASLSKGVDIQYDVEIDELMDPEEVEVPSMILQPFIENAIEHGFSGLSDGTISLKFSIVGRNLVVSITDDGVGFQSAHKNGHESLALKVIRDRLSMMPRPGFFDLHLKDPKAKQRRGTVVNIKLPLDKEYG